MFEEKKMTWGEIKKKIDEELEDDAKIRLLKISDCDDIAFSFCSKTRDYVICGKEKVENKAKS